MIANNAQEGKQTVRWTWAWRAGRVSDGSQAPYRCRPEAGVIRGDAGPAGSRAGERSDDPARQRRVDTPKKVREENHRVKTDGGFVLL